MENVIKSSKLDSNDFKRPTGELATKIVYVVLFLSDDI